MNDRVLNTSLTVVAFIIGIIGFVMGIMIMSGNENVVDAAITFSIGCMIVAAGAAIIFGIIQFFGNFKQNITALIGIVVLVIIGFICYSLADGEVLNVYDDSVTSMDSKLSGAGLYFMYILIVLAVGAAIIGELTRLFK